MRGGESKTWKNLASLKDRCRYQVKPANGVEVGL